MEFFSLTLNKNIKSVEELFSIYTDNIFLGESKIERWSSFYDLLYLRLMSSDINLTVNHDKKFTLGQKDMEYYKDLLKEMKNEFPEKIYFNFS